MGMDFDFGIGEAIGGWLGYSSAKKANDMNRDMTVQNREWQERMSNSAHVRETNDLANAGLNRILSVSKGGPGASTPSGGIGNPMVPESLAGVTTALAVRRQKEEIKTLQEQRRGVSASSDIQEYERDYEAARYEAANAVTDKDGNVTVTPYWRDIIREELNARMAAARAGQDQPGASLELTKMQSLLSKLQGEGQKLSNSEKSLLVEILRKEQPGHLDAAGIWSSTAGNVRRRSDLTSEGFRKWLPWGGAGNSARSMTIRGH